MSPISRLRVAFFALFLVSTGAFAAPKPYVNDDLASSSTRLEQKLADDSADLRAHNTTMDLRQQAVALGQQGDAAQTLPILGAIAASAPDSVADWLMFARASLGAAAAKGDNADALKDQALAAAFTAYRHARVKTEEAASLALIGDIFAAREAWRDALNAYRASLDAFALPPVQKTYDDLREKYGFRVLDYRIDNESANPRVCFQFSEDLARGRGDFSPFVTLDGRSDAAVSNEERQICVEGLKHGEHYDIALRQGLPSAVGENLLRNQDYQVYVRDRSPQAHFTGRNYVLPRVGPEGVPIVSVNTSRVKVKIFRVGDRNLLPTIRSEDFLAQLSAMRLKQFGDSDGQKIWSGTLDVKSEINQDVVTDFPVLEALRQPQPGVYVMSASAVDDLAANGDDDEDYSLRATQWFVVSDLGLTAFSARDGVTALVRSLATAEPKAGVEARLIAKNNELLAKAVTDAKGEVHFAPGLSRGEGGLSARPHRRQRWQGRLQFPRPPAERLRPHRPWRGGARPARSARRFRLCRARRLSLGRDRASGRADARRQWTRRRRAADPGRQASRRGGIFTRALGGSGTGRTDARCGPARRRRLGRLDGPGFCRPQKPGDRRSRLPGRGLRSRAHGHGPDPEGERRASG